MKQDDLLRSFARLTDNKGVPLKQSAYKTTKTSSKE